MGKLGACFALLVAAAFFVAGFVPVVACPHSEPHWCEVLAKLKRMHDQTGLGGDPRMWIGCPRCRDQRRVTLARWLVGPPPCECVALTK